MDNKEINEKLYKLADRNDIYECWGGKAIPYIGWYWRTIYIDNWKYNSFGLLPTGEVGFMQNNKWDYNYVEFTEEDWNDITKLLLDIVENPIEDNYKKLHVRIQNLRGKIK